MAYANYEFYTGTYLGRMPESDFAEKAERASEYLDDITMGRAKSYTATDAVKRACCAVADVMRDIQNPQKISSENNDGYSVSYEAGPAPKSEEQRLADAAVRHLRWTGLLYRGYL